MTWCAPARADDARNPASDNEPLTPRVALRHDVWLDLGVSAGLAGGAAAWALARPSVLTIACALCDGSPRQVNALDDFVRTALKRQDIGPASTMSDVFGYGLAPVSALALTSIAAVADRRGDEAIVDVLLVLEASAVDLAIDETLISVTRRERPAYHFSTDAERASSTAGNVSSLPSGHTSIAFAMGFSAATVATMRGYRVAPLLWAMGAIIGVTTGYLRIAADRHYFTDVLGGATVGSLTGIGVPLVFHSPERGERAGLLQHTRISTSPVPGGRVVELGWAL